MNRRNRQIFGLSQKTKYAAMSVVIGVVLIAALFFMRGESLTTAAVTNQPSNQLTGSTAQQQQEQQTSQEQQQEEVQQEQQEEREYHTYQGQCAFDIKQRQDDLADTTSNVNMYQQEINKLTEEYEKKKKEIEDQYNVPITNLKVKLEKAQKEVDMAEQRYNEAKVSCNLQQPA